jgi:alpha-tubulin suppressor-like RCC1 family protein
MVSLLASEKIADVTCGDSHAVAVSEGGQIYGWGKGFSLESKVEVVSFYPKRLSELTRHHFF